MVLLPECTEFNCHQLLFLSKSKNPSQFILIIRNSQKDIPASRDRTGTQVCLKMHKTWHITSTLLAFTRNGITLWRILWSRKWCHTVRQTDTNVSDHPTAAMPRSLTDRHQRSRSPYCRHATQSDRRTPFQITLLPPCHTVWQTNIVSDHPTATMPQSDRQTPTFQITLLLPCHAVWQMDTNVSDHPTAIMPLSLTDGHQRFRSPYCRHVTQSERRTPTFQINLLPPCHTVWQTDTNVSDHPTATVPHSLTDGHQHFRSPYCHCATQFDRWTLTFQIILLLPSSQFMRLHNTNTNPFNILSYFSITSVSENCLNFEILNPENEICSTIPCARPVTEHTFPSKCWNQTIFTKISLTSSHTVTM